MKKIIRRKKTTSAASEAQPNVTLFPPWQVLIVDDEPDIHAITRLALSGFEFSGRPLEILTALSGSEAREVLMQHPKIVVAIIDVVMETDDAGLQLVDFIRNEQNNVLTRLIIRTGQPGLAPEKDIIERYDIDDYKEKNELTETKLYTTLRLALKSYQALSSLNTHRGALTKILDAAPELYHPQSIKQFFDGVLSQIISLCHLGENSLISTLKSGFVATTAKDDDISIHAGTGHFADGEYENNRMADQIKKNCIACLESHKDSEHSILYGDPLPEKAMLIRLQIDKQANEESQSFIYLENAHCLLRTDKELLKIMAYQCASALKNLQLYMELKAAHHQTSQLLSMAEHARDIAESANSAKTIFLAKMSHELRTPLNAIIGYSTLIEEEAEDFGYSDMMPDLKKIQGAGQQLLSMISGILDVTKIESEQYKLELEQFMLTDLVENIVTLMHPLVERHRNQLTVEYAQDIGQVCTDPAKLKQILLNLLHNANKFTQCGQVTLHISYTFNSGKNIKLCDPEDIDCNKCNLVGILNFRIEDTGVGIPEDHLESIFETFMQVDKTSATTDGTTPGAGLGLSISRQLCQALGGEIKVNSHLGKGSIFTMHLPINLRGLPEVNTISRLS